MNILHEIQPAKAVHTPSEPAPLLQPVPPPEPALRPPRKKLPATIIAGILIALCGLGYWKHAALISLFDLALPYVTAAAFTTLGIVGLLYKDWNKYEHPFAARAALGMFIVFGILMGVNTHHDRQSAQRKDTANAGALNSLRADLRQEMKTNTAHTTQRLDSIDGELQDFKDKVKPDEIRSDMSGLRSTIEKALHPPKASLDFTFTPFVNPPVDGKTIIPIREVTLPLKSDGAVQVRFALVNNTDVPADGAQLALKICIGCKFAKEPKGFTKIEGSPEDIRNYIYGDMPAGAHYPELVVDVIPPANVSAFGIEVQHRCKSCLLARTGTKGTVHIQRN